MAAAGVRAGSNGRSGARREALPALHADPILERLDGPPPALPPANESPHDKARRALIDAPGQWLVLHARVKLNEATARRLARSYQRAKPARLVEAAAGKFAARPFVRDDTWLVAVAYQPLDGENPQASASAAP